jgi:tRNA modification GTPase
VLGDTIFAVASPPGAGARGVVRVSGPRALDVVHEVVHPAVPRARGSYAGSVAVLGFEVECLVLVMPGPGSYTGEDVVELHLPGSPLLLEKVLDRLRRGGRDATPGEFTRRAFENEKLDLLQVEAVLALIHAAGEDERQRAAYGLAGGLAHAIDAVRGEIEAAWALVEGGLDFTEDETGAVATELWQPRVRSALAALRRLRASLPVAAIGGEVLLQGAANAGKSSLANALAGRAEVLVADAAGTTRDVIAVEIAPGVCLLDGPGDFAADVPMDAEALELRDRIARRATHALWVVDATAPWWPSARLPLLAVAVTKIDLAPVPAIAAAAAGVPCFPVSSVTGAGIAALRAFVCARARGGPMSGAGRVADLLAASAAALERAVAAGADGGELVAADLAEALHALDELHGRSTPEDVLDRVFARFCLGK